jgi:anaerobic magnesium-protoporphyrin IX monomethyl ester cyclase
MRKQPTPGVLLLNPQTPYYEMRYMKRPSRIWQPISLGYIAAMLEQRASAPELREERAPEITLLDANALGLPPAGVAQRAVEVGPSVVVLNSAQHDRWQNPIPTIDHVRDLIDALTSAVPDAIYVLLGPHGTALPADVFEKIPAIDFIVRGEPEVTTVELIERLVAGKPTDDLAGISFVRDGACIDNPDAPFVDDLDELPLPAYHLLPMDRYRYRGEATDPGQEDERFAIMITSRGCPYQCSYCSLTMLGHRYRARSIDKVLEEVDLLAGKYGVRKIIFHDQVLTLKQPRVKALCEGIIALGHDIEWYCQGVVNRFPTDLLGLMKQAGCRQINFGLESGVEEVSGRMRKNSVADFVEIYEEGQKVGVGIVPNHMVGLPGETPELARKSNEFYKQFGFKYYFAAPTIPYPGTQLYEIGRRDGTIKDETWEAVLDATGQVDNSFDRQSMGEQVDELFEEERRQEEQDAKPGAAG